MLISLSTGSEKELGTDYIDIVQLHCMTDGKWTDQQKRQMDIPKTLKSKKQSGHGVSVHGFEPLLLPRAAGSM
ncbi:MAG: hypothetical protein U0X39_14720 [Bacteroidales bacterium]